MKKLDLDYYTLFEKYDWLEGYLGSEYALKAVIEALDNVDEARNSLLLQDAYGDYIPSMTVEAWWLESCGGLEAVQHLDYIGYDTVKVVDELLIEHGLDEDEVETFESVARMIN